MSEETIFAAALEKSSPAERAAYLDQACAGDAAMRRRVEALLQSHFHGGSFLETPAVQRAAEELKEPACSGDTQGEPPGGEELGLDFLSPSDRPSHLGRLGHYEVLEVIGRGGMGIVLRAFDEKLHRVVAIKVMAAQLATNAAARKRFTREAQAAAAVSHDHIVTIHAVEEANGLPYLVMQYVAGMSLQERLDRDGPLQLPEILRIGMQTAAGLAAAHAQGLIHRDIKPANILLENGVERVKLTDFGLARAAADASLTQSGVVAGTPQYMSPEQACGEAVDHRCDLFSLGSVLYAMCTGRPPFRAPGNMAVLKRVCEETPSPIRETNPEVPDRLVALIEKLHAKAPAERYQSAAEVAELLSRHLAHVQHPSVVQPLAALSRLPSQRRGDRGEGSGRSHRRRWAVAAAALLCLVAGLGLTEATGVIQLRATVIRIFTPEGTLVVEVDDPGVKVTIEGDGGLVITGAGPQEVRLKPGQYQVKATRNGKLVKSDLVTITRGDKQIVKVSQESAPAVGEIYRFERHTSGIDRVFFSPDGRRALSTDRDQAVIFWDLETGRELRRFTDGSTTASATGGLAYSPTGHQALFAGKDGTLALWDLETGQVLRRFESTAKTHSVVFSRDGRRALSSHSDQTIRLWDVRTGRELGQLKGPKVAGGQVAFSPDGRQALSDGGKTLLLWDLETGKVIHRFEGHRAGIWSLDFSPDGRRVVSSGYDWTARVWDVGTGKELRRFVHTGATVMCVRFSPDGRRILTGTGESVRTVRLWDIETGAELCRLKGHTHAVTGVAFSPDGRQALSASWDGTVRLWQLPPPDKK